MSDMRDEFEQRFPVPAGIYWNDISEQYDALPGAAGFDDVEIYHGQWMGWQSARAQSGQGVEPVAFQVYWYENDCEFYESLLPSFGDDPQQIVPLYDHPQPAQQDMYRRLADKYRQDLFECQDELNNLRSEYHNRMAELEGEIEELRPAQQGSVPDEAVNLARKWLGMVEGGFLHNDDITKMAEALVATPQPAQQGSAQRWPALPDKFYEGLGWMHAECCAALDAGEDPRGFEIGEMVERCIRDLTTPPAGQEGSGDEH